MLVSSSESEPLRWMDRAVGLARKGEGLTRPNPPVGCVIVKNGNVIGEGFHRRAGGPHAEIEALNAAGSKASGADVYVTLEPCSTFGRTPPCTEALIRHNVKKVVIGCKDPNPNHAGRGLTVLRKAGISVVCFDYPAAEQLIRPFAKWINSGQPCLTLKMAMTFDGKIADKSGRSKWITGPAARERVQEMRRAADAIMVGAGTVKADNPSLLPRPARGRKPWRVIVDGMGRSSVGAHVYNDTAADRTILFTTERAPSEKIKKWEGKGVDVVCRASKTGNITMRSIMKDLGRRGLLHVLCEGGGNLAASLVKESCVDEYAFFMAPAILGGINAVPPVGGRGFRIADRRELCWEKIERIGNDVLLRARPQQTVSR